MIAYHIHAQLGNNIDLESHVKDSEVHEAIAKRLVAFFEETRKAHPDVEIKAHLSSVSVYDQGQATEL